MEIRKWMKHPVHTVKPLDSIQHARELMASHRVNQLPVVVDGCLVGIITDRDLRDAFPSVFDAPVFTTGKAKTTAADPRTLTVEMVMTANVTTVGPTDSMADAVRRMQRERIGALPVVDGKHIVGIVTRSDVLGCFLALEEGRESGSVIEKSTPMPVVEKGARHQPQGQRKSR